MLPQRDPIAVGPLSVRFLVEASESNGTVTVFECDVPAGARTPAPHSHDGFEETVYGLQGSSTWTIDGQPVEIRRGDAVCIPRGAVHRFDNRGEVDARFLAIATPGVFGPTYFEEIGALLASSAGPPDGAAIAELMRRHGLTPAAPTAA
jgi:quercetin dioxygenase-like cupin family protein